ncbi:MAG: YraN family protein [Pseudomonadota bacterium]
MNTLSTTQQRVRRHRHGILGEYAALAYLTLKGYRFVAQRFKTPLGEVDLVMRRGDTLVFVEVKMRSRIEDAAIAVHIKNQSRVSRAAQLFLAAHPAYASHQVRFDVVLVTWYKRPHHILNAF